ncbi:hypothetical protein [Nonlabens agnitus]|uniref:Thioredoxin domain-containing protein n=1 Tax=Nonlabens agnitus TaxID=870484 RepID=A0A2S9WSG6_9FLAO|nr:hypothetical protein [Nonlabens agnitus]PRP66417.1 hypothetical protein BST86_04585 [Nonlabens agnitus]
MDIAKFKIVSFLILLFISAPISWAQYDIPIYVTTTTTENVPVRIVTNSLVDQVYERVDSAYRSGFGGFNSLIVENKIFPIHLEDFDDFNAAVFKNDSLITVIYSGAQGALKNEYLITRNEVYTEFANQKDLLKQPMAQLAPSMDSLTNVWMEKLKSMPFSELFKEDEAMYYKSFQAYVKLAHQQYQMDQTTSLEDLELQDFPDMDFSSNRYYTTIPQYKAMAQVYNFKKLLQLEKVRYGRRFVNDLDGFITSDLKKKAFVQSTEHHPRADFLYDISKPLYNPHTSKERRLYRKSKKTGKGSDFEYPEVQTVDGASVNFNNFQGKKIQLLVYSFRDPFLRQNLTKWNKFAVQQEPDTYYVAYGVDASLYEDTWKELQFSSQLAGLNVKASPKDGFEFREDLGILLLPRVISIDANGVISNPNLDLDFEKSVPLGR